jgi:integrase/recombinase XerD
MNATLPNTLARALRGFFTEQLPQLRGLSPHTVPSYRDSLALLLRFAAAYRGCPVAVLDVAALDSEAVIAFLQHLEDTRGNTPATRNVRLAAVHAFFRYLTLQHPDCLEQAQRVLNIPFKRARPRPVEYLEYAEIQAVLAAVDRRTADGERDYALLTTLFNWGFRVVSTRLGAKPRQTRAAAISGILACAYTPEGWLGCAVMARTRLGSGIARDLKTCRTGCETSFIRKKRCVGV